MPNLGDEVRPVVADDVPGEGAAQLRRPEGVHSAARNFFGANVHNPPPVAGDESPHKGDPFRV